MPVINYNDVMSNPIVYKYQGPGSGYVYVGAPPVPNPPAAPPSVAEPGPSVEDKSWHILTPPGNATTFKMQWLKDKKCWVPQNQLTSNRVAFSSKYLAACGWVYTGVLDA